MNEEGLHPFGFQELHCLPAVRIGPIHDDHTGALMGETDGAGPPNSGPGAGNHDNGMFNSHRSQLSAHFHHVSSEQTAYEWIV